MIKRYGLTVLLLLVATITTMLLSGCDKDEELFTSDESFEGEIVRAVESHLAEQRSSFDEFVVNVEQMDGDFVRVQIISTVASEPGGFTAFLQRVNGNWIVLKADSDFTSHDLQILGIPESILPEGWVLSADTQESLTLSDRCPQATADTLIWVDESLDFCLLYPASHTVIQLESGNREFVVGEVMNHIDPRISITGEDLAGRTLSGVVEDFLSGYIGFEIDRNNVMVDGHEAVMLDRVPGQDFYRTLFVEHAGLLYQLSFAPYDPALDNIAQAEELYALATDSFRFTTP